MLIEVVTLEVGVILIDGLEEVERVALGVRVVLIVGDGVRLDDGVRDGLALTEFVALGVPVVLVDAD